MKSHLPGDTPLLSPRDVNFLLYEWLEVESLCKRPRFAEHSPATFDAVQDLAADIAAGLLAPHNKLADSAEITVGPDGSIQTIPDTKQALDALGAAGLLAGEFDEALGGMQLPYVISKAAFAWLQAANVSTSAGVPSAQGPARRLDRKLSNIAAGRYTADDFVIADAKDADMAFGLTAAGPVTGGLAVAAGPGRYRTRGEYLAAMRALIAQDELDILLASAANGERLAGEGSLEGMTTGSAKSFVACVS